MKITYPSIDKLLDRVDSRYSLSVLASKELMSLKQVAQQHLKNLNHLSQLVKH